MNREATSFIRRWGLTLLICAFLIINLLLCIPLGTSPTRDSAFVDYYVPFSALAAGPIVFFMLESVSREIIMIIGSICLVIFILLAIRNLRGKKLIPFAGLFVSLWFFAAYAGVYIDLASITG